MKMFLRTVGVGGMVWLAVAGVSQTAPTATPAPVQAAVPARAAAPATPENQIATMQAKLDDWPALGRYKAENAALAPPAADEQRVVFYGDSITDAWGRRPGTGTFFPGEP